MVQWWNEELCPSRRATRVRCGPGRRTSLDGCLTSSTGTEGRRSVPGSVLELNKPLSRAVDTASMDKETTAPSRIGK